MLGQDRLVAMFSGGDVNDRIRDHFIEFGEYLDELLPAGVDKGSMFSYLVRAANFAHKAAENLLPSAENAETPDTDTNEAFDTPVAHPEELLDNTVTEKQYPKDMFES